MANAPDEFINEKQAKGQPQPVVSGGEDPISTVATLDEKWGIVVDGKRTGDYLGILENAPAFNKDGDLEYIAVTKDAWIHGKISLN